MKTISVILVFFGFTCIAQTDTNFNYIRTHLRKISAAPDNESNTILTQRGINIYFARKVASYLSGDNDLSLYKNYAIADIGDGKFFFGRNFQIRKTVDDRISNLITAGIKANADDNNFAKLFSAGSFNGDIGLDLKYTHIFSGRIDFDCQVQQQKSITHIPGPQQRKMKIIRKINSDKIDFQISNDSTSFFTSLKSTTDTVERDSLIKKFLITESKNIKRKFAEMEADEFEENDNTHNSSHIYWLSLSGYVPLTNSSYSVADNFTAEFSEKKFRPWEGNIVFTYVRENIKSGKWFFLIGTGAYLNNSIKNEDLDKIDLNKYKLLGGKDTITIAQLSSDPVYIGVYKNFLTYKIKVQITYFPPCIGWAGINFGGEQFYGNYNPLNLQLGFPLVFNGKDKDSKVNIELQLKAFDVRNTVFPEKNFNDKLSVGLSVGLPFSSIIY